MDKKTSTQVDRNTNGKFAEGKSGNPGGMVVGTKKRADLVKQAFMESFDRTGSTDGLVKWAKKAKNRGVYYRILASLLPKEVDITVPDELMEKYKDVSANEIKARIAELAARFGGGTGAKGDPKAKGEG